MTSLSLSVREAKRQSVDRGLLTWGVTLLIVALCLLAQDRWSWLASYPKAWTLPLAPAIDRAAEWVGTTVQPVTRGIAALIDVPMRAFAATLAWLPWPTLVAFTAALALLAAGRKLALFGLAACAYILLAGYWRQSLNTLVLVTLAIPISLVPGFLLGVLAQRVKALRPAIETLLDLMQTVPAFAYLIPLLLLFGFGPVTGLVASAIFAMPPMVRNTWLGLERVPVNVKEAGVMNGGTPWQRFWLVEVPTALPQMMVGINQTTLAALSMVIIATIIGGFEDIGWEVLNATRMAQLGQSLLSGFVIVLMAILIDRITRGAAERVGAHRPRRRTGFDRACFIVLAIVGVAGLALRLLDPGNALLDFGRHDLIQVGAINTALLDLVRQHGAAIGAVKNAVQVYLLLPLRIGLVSAIVPEFWGFSLTPPVIAGYAVLVGLCVALAVRLSGWRSGIAILTGGMMLYYGIVGFPWPAFMVLIAVLGWRTGGWRVSLFAILGFGFMLVVGLWKPLTLSLYLCGLAVILSVVLGGLIGVWAASSNRVSAIVSPINDTLQTIPQFVFLIPAVMFFKVGDVTALMAVMLYAIVPPIRYVEHGLRSVRPDIVEAARQIGCTPFQLFWQVKLPLARPVIMLGVNQTIMAALSMLAIAAMVGTRDLGQQVYIALGKADTGLGLLAGLSIALIAMISDRIIRAWADTEATAQG